MLLRRHGQKPPLPGQLLRKWRLLRFGESSRCQEPSSSDRRIDQAPTLDGANSGAPSEQLGGPATTAVTTRNAQTPGQGATPNLSSSWSDANPSTQPLAGASQRATTTTAPGNAAAPSREALTRAAGTTGGNIAANTEIAVDVRTPQKAAAKLPRGSMPRPRPRRRVLTREQRSVRSPLRQAVLTSIRATPHKSPARKPRPRTPRVARAARSNWPRAATPRNAIHSAAVRNSPKPTPALPTFPTAVLAPRAADNRAPAAPSSAPSHRDRRHTRRTHRLARRSGTRTRRRGIWGRWRHWIARRHRQRRQYQQLGYGHHHRGRNRSPNRPHQHWRHGRSCNNRRRHCACGRNEWQCRSPDGVSGAPLAATSSGLGRQTAGLPGPAITGPLGAVAGDPSDGAPASSLGSGTLAAPVRATGTGGTEQLVAMTGGNLARTRGATIGAGTDKADLPSLPTTGEPGAPAAAPVLQPAVSPDQRRPSLAKASTSKSPSRAATPADSAIIIR